MKPSDELVATAKMWFESRGMDSPEIMHTMKVEHGWLILARGEHDDRDWIEATE